MLLSKCYYFINFYYVFQAWKSQSDISNVFHGSRNPGTRKVTSCQIYCTALDKSPVKCVKIHSGEEVRRRGTVGIQMEGRLGLIVREAKWLWCGCCALRAGGVSLVVGVEVRSGSILMVSPSTLTIPHSLHHSQLLLPISPRGLGQPLSRRLKWSG